MQSQLLGDALLERKQENIAAEKYTEEITPLLSYIDKNYSYRNDYERNRYQEKILTR